MKRKSVLILEDRVALRGLLKAGLEKRGFLVASAADERDAREKSENLGADLDVVLIDVELGKGGNGLDFGMSLKEEWNQQGRSLPEFLVFSGHEKPNYYQAAFRLGAATYLQKGEIGGDPGDPVTLRPVRIDRVAHHVKALALRRALRSERPGRAEEIQTIVRKSHSLEDALEGFCADLLSVELEATLGGNFILLLARPQRKILCFTGSVLNLGYFELFEGIEAAVHDKLGDVEPFVVDARDPMWAGDLHASENKILDQLNGAAFISLGEAKEYRLVLGIAPDAHSSSESAVELAKILGRYLNSAVVAHWLGLTEEWSKLEMESRLVLLRSTSDFCLYQGQELEALLQEAEEQGKEQDGKVPLGKLHAVAQELRGAGEMLAQVELLADRKRVDAGCERIEVDELLYHRWSSGLSGHLRLPDTTLLIEGKCSAEAPKVEVEKAVSQILFWLGRRLTRLPRKEETPRVIRCHLDQEGGRARILFEEHTSRRMPKRMRDLLFAPFTSLPLPEPGKEIDDEALKGHRLGLYLARILAETVGGSLEEESDAIPGDFGHRFVLQLPAAR